MFNSSDQPSGQNPDAASQQRIHDRTLARVRQAEDILETRGVLPPHLRTSSSPKVHPSSFFTQISAPAKLLKEPALTSTKATPAVQTPSSSSAVSSNQAKPTQHYRRVNAAFTGSSIMLSTPYKHSSRATPNLSTPAPDSTPSNFYSKPHS